MRTLKVYLAAPYQMKETIKARAAELKAEGLIVTSSWLQEPHKPTDGPEDLTYKQNQNYAIQDVEDVRMADMLIFQGDETKKIIRAGRHVEFGIAIGIALERGYMPIWVVGQDRENIFHYLPQVKHFESWEAVKRALVKIPYAVQA
jgi:hypothetical protein